MDHESAIKYYYYYYQYIGRMNYDLSFVVTIITVTCYSWAPSSGDHIFTCGAIYRPPHIPGLFQCLSYISFGWNFEHSSSSFIHLTFAKRQFEFVVFVSYMVLLYFIL